LGHKRGVKQSNVPRDTLERYVKDNTESLEELDEVNLGRWPILPDDIDTELEKHFTELDSRYYGLRRDYVKRTGFQLAIRNCI
jgi:hypothetical protein